MRPLIAEARNEHSRGVLTSPTPWDGDIANFLAVRNAVQAIASDTGSS